MQWVVHYLDLTFIKIKQVVKYFKIDFVGSSKTASDRKAFNSKYTLLQKN